MTFYNVRCKKSGEQGKVDVGDMSPADVRELQEKHRRGGGGYSCQIGHHVELSGGVLSCLEVDFDTVVDPTSVKVPTLESLMNEYVFVRTADEINHPLSDVEITGFAAGFAMAKLRAFVPQLNMDEGTEITLDYTNVEPHGRVYYFSRKRS